MKPLVLYHADCADGFGAAFAAWLKLGDGAEYVPVQHGDILEPAVYTGREVYVLDFSYPRETMDGLFEMAKRVVWLDHHASSFKMWCPENTSLGRFSESIGTEYREHGYIVLDNNKSGALLSWEFFHPDTEPPLLIRHIDDRDRWVFAIPGSREIHAALAIYKPWTFEDWRARYFDVLVKEDAGYLYREGAAILRAHDQNVQDTAKQARKCDLSDPLGEAIDEWNFPGPHGLAVNCPPFMASDVGHELAVQSGTFGLCWFQDKDGRVRCSLRSNAPYDVEVIAKALGGGGHAQAAGFETTMETLQLWLR
jgi:oligoribonuclease NrnB/cAMP/cGMP phosphodiesterase (DHH superfamily)